jgi:CxxC motif-containing protein
MSERSTEWSRQQRKHGFCTTCGKSCDVKKEVDGKKVYYSLCPKHRQAQLDRMLKIYETKGY